MYLLQYDNSMQVIIWDIYDNGNVGISYQPFLHDIITSITRNCHAKITNIVNTLLPLECYNEAN